MTPVLTQKDRQIVLAELERFTLDDPSRVATLLERASAWVKGVSEDGGAVEQSLVRDVTGLSSYARSEAAEARRLAVAALVFILQGDANSRTPSVKGRLAVDIALTEIRTRCGYATSYDPPPVTADEKARAESMFVLHAQQPLYPDAELQRRVAAFCGELQPLANAPFVARLVKGVERLRHHLATGEAEQQAWARGGLSYVLRTDDAIDDRLGLAGLLDDLYVVETAVRFVEPGRAPLNEVLSALVSSWPFVLDLNFEENGVPHPASEYLLLNAAFACRNLVSDGATIGGLVVILPGTQPIPFLVGCVAALGEQLRLLREPVERFRPGERVLFNGDACAIYRGRVLDPLGAPKIELELRVRGRQGAGDVVRRQVPLWAESYLSPAPASRKLSGNIPPLGAASSRPLSSLQRLFHLRDPAMPSRAAKTVVVVTKRRWARAIADGIAIGGAPLSQVIPIGHLRKDGTTASWSESVFGAQPPVMLCSGGLDRAAEYAGRHPDVSQIIIDHDETVDGQSLKQVSDAGVPFLSFVRDDGGLREALTEYRCAPFRTWRWSDDDLKQLVWRDTQTRGIIPDSERRVRSTTAGDLTVVRVAHDQIVQLDLSFEKARRHFRGAGLEEAVWLSECFFVYVDLLRTHTVLDPAAVLDRVARLSLLERKVKRDRFMPAAERTSFDEVSSGLRSLVRDLGQDNPKGEALKKLESEAPGLQVLRAGGANVADIDPRYPVAVLGWMNRLKMQALLSPPVGWPLYLLLYPPEEAWYRLAQGRRAGHVSDPDSRQLVFSALGLEWGERTNDRVTPPAAIAPHREHHDFDTICDEAYRVLGHHALSRYASETGEKVDARLVVFREGACAFLTEGYDANVVSHLLQEKAPAYGETPRVSMRRPDQLRAGDSVLFSEEGRNAIRDCADKYYLQEGQRAQAKEWQRALRAWADGRQLNAQQICERLANAGCAHHPSTVKNWLQDEMLIGPRRESDLRTLALLMDDPEAAGKADAWGQAIHVVKSAHQRAAARLAEQVIAHAAQVIAREHRMPAMLDDVCLVTVEHVAEHTHAVPRSGTNRLIIERQADDGEIGEQE